jgi:pimeloyl-ACP methyl ester carboxylesterase
MGSVVRNARLRLSQGQIFWRETGRGEAIAFIHREYGDGSQWLDFLENLSSEYHCFAPDLLGFGDSDSAVKAQSIQWQSNVLAELLSHLNLKKIYLVGDSLGAWIATRLALDHPEYIQGLILLDPIGFNLSGNNNYFLTKLLLLPVPIVPFFLRIVQPIAQLLGLKKNIQKLLDYRKLLLDSPASQQLLFQRRTAQIQAEYLQPHLAKLTVPTFILSSPEQGHQGTLFSRALPQAGIVFTKDQTEAIALIRDWLQQQQS